MKAGEEAPSLVASCYIWMPKVIALDRSRWMTEIFVSSWNAEGLYHKRDEDRWALMWADLGNTQGCPLRPGGPLQWTSRCPWLPWVFSLRDGPTENKMDCRCCSSAGLRQSTDIWWKLAQTLWWINSVRGRGGISWSGFRLKIMMGLPNPGLQKLGLSI